VAVVCCCCCWWVDEEVKDEHIHALHHLQQHLVGGWGVCLVVV
jgi:hypothetical protein